MILAGVASHKAYRFKFNRKYMYNIYKSAQPNYIGYLIFPQNNLLIVS